MAKRSSHSLDPEDVLRGRWRPDSAALCALIRSVNPTGVELPAAERGRRYALKSKLQSVLVLRFGDEVEVSFDPAAGEGFALLRHRPTASTAGHALIAELEDEARSWVQHQIDVGGSPGAADKALPASAPRPSSPRPSSPRPSSPRPSSPRQSRPESPPAGGEGAGDLLEQGRRAVLEYDYDGARSLLSQALERSQGGAAAAEALLDLLVEQLGADLDALALVDSLGAAALAEPRVRRHLAIAAARSGDRAAALRFVKGVAEEHVAEVFAALARGALGGGDVVAATRDLAEVRGRDPAHPELRALGESLEQARAASRRPLEERVVALVAAGRLDEAEAAARDAGLETSKSAEVRAALRILQERARRARAAELLARADEAQGRGDFQGAIGVLRRLLLEQPEAEAGPVTERLAAAEAAEQSRAEAGEAQRVVRLLAAVDPVEGMIAYVGAAAEVRARVRALSPRTELERLDDTGVADTGARARAAVAAVVALARAEAVAASAPEAALALLESHHRLLQNVRAARKVRERGEAARLARLRAEALQNLLSARTLLAPLGLQIAGEVLVAPTGGSCTDAALAQGQALLSDTTIRHLDGPMRALALAWRRHVDLTVEHNARADHVAALAGRGEVGAARAFVEEYIAGIDPAVLGPDSPEIKALRNVPDRLSRKYFHVRVAGESARELGARRIATPIVTDEAVPMAELWGMSFVDLGGVEESTGDGQLVLLSAQGVHLFVRFIDLSGAPLLRNLVVLRMPQPFRLRCWEVRPDRLVAVSSQGAILSLSLPDFRVLSWRRPEDWPPRAYTSGPPLVADVALSAEHGLVWTIENRDRSRRVLRVFDLERMRTVHEERLEGRSVRVEPVTSVPGATAVVFGCPAGTVELRGADGKPVPGGRFTLEVQPRCTGPHPRGGLFVIGLSPATGAIGAVRLVPGETPVSPQPIEGLAAERVRGCGADRAANLVFVLQDSGNSGRQLFALSAEESGFELRYRVAVPGHSLLVTRAQMGRAELLVLGRGLFRSLPLGAEAPEVPEDPSPRPALDVSRSHLEACKVGGASYHAKVEVGHRHADIRSWTDAVASLRGVDEARLDDASARHLAHVLGLSLLQKGEHDEAHRVLLRGLERPGVCDLGVLLAVAAPLDEESPALDAERSLRELLRRVAAADVCLAAGDPAGAIAVLDDALIWEAREVQTMARLVRALLQVEEREPDFQLRKLFAVVTFCEVVEEQGPGQSDLCLRARWSLEDLYDLQEKALDWLSALNDEGLEDGSRA